MKARGKQSSMRSRLREKGTEVGENVAKPTMNRFQYWLSLGVWALFTTIVLLFVASALFSTRAHAWDALLLLIVAPPAALLVATLRIRRHPKGARNIAGMGYFLAAMIVAAVYSIYFFGSLVVDVKCGSVDEPPHLVNLYQEPWRVADAYQNLLRGITAAGDSLSQRVVAALGVPLSVMAPALVAVALFEFARRLVPRAR